MKPLFHQHNRPPLIFFRNDPMAQTGVITFKGNPMTLEGEGLEVGSAAPDFAHCTTPKQASRR